MNLTKFDSDDEIHVLSSTNRNRYASHTSSRSLHDSTLSSSNSHQGRAGRAQDMTGQGEYEVRCCRAGQGQGNERAGQARAGCEKSPCGHLWFLRILFR